MFIAVEFYLLGREVGFLWAASGASWATIPEQLGLFWLETKPKKGMCRQSSKRAEMSWGFLSKGSKVPGILIPPV